MLGVLDHASPRAARGDEPVVGLVGGDHDHLVLAERPVVGVHEVDVEVDPHALVVAGPGRKPARPAAQRRPPARVLGCGRVPSHEPVAPVERVGAVAFERSNPSTYIVSRLPSAEPS